MENLVKKFKNKKVLITGHTGFKGAWLSKILLNWGAEVSGIALEPVAGHNMFEALKIKKDISNHFLDIRDFIKLKKAVAKEKPEIVFHLAAQPIVRESYNNPLYTFNSNVMGTANLLEAIRETSSAKSVVIITTDKVYKNNDSGNPFKEEDHLGGHDPYSGSKAAAEIVVDSYTKSFFNPADYKKKHGTLIASARAGNVIGGGDWGTDRLIPDLVKGIFGNKDVTIRNPEGVRPWQHVLDALSGYLLLAAELHGGKKEYCGGWNFGPDEKSFLTVKEVLEMALKILGRGSYIVKRNPNDQHEAKLLRLNSDRAKMKLGWHQKMNTAKTLQSTFEWYKSFYNKEDVIAITNKQIKLFFNKGKNEN
ncbi:MAG: CDP-glucose 4,6-dehydratase [Candidatus Zambryskibacteria bacterium RIFCSPLOWO2_01_FULL_39_39]|uniref:CDP-glucose 4,6-dehydratase n=1 Tax=Candidatus Zambryskibacteria bacterium RIFCSPLOWO2_01_FULL_39_39 TaxID=1802758 RepID=A0A1G2U0J7_9BACT|nr:MAG: CDP-glucose 4,6-dehydratase [Parcubacteria group bacterium GW2011_GWA1_38_7]OHA87556.1 MAG: CDP-glucose 4,6-dehydratase [Candidatus Zambryskibacteria bacterium RIFCSPHIGHO2_01_FULL_39_63]OHA95084.1 MAG: CDP-glucose 4,6-dehydratase [Candidatus Zambryskibacteria bacterium RIFCSPHIGHO2_02_FULL_39_19]OHA98204.1 MAG: CDP-glucose 4,6-dehydratase [Candidatus Zambryskibacteria bacterium RIFCSPHIGHO2_12_FULL_39_21]OHB02430.1 MAG: CDP-glucose 4,6-dehydratase [Candidatus Zambryskibacteria bacteriu